MMSIREYANKVTERMTSIMGNDEIIITSRTITKDNGIQLQGITIKKIDADVAPTFYIDDLFKTNVDIDAVAQRLLKEYKEKTGGNFAHVGEDFTNWDKMKRKIIMRVVNTERNKEMLADMPHIEKKDLSIIFVAVIQVNNEGMATAKIHNAHMKKWGVSVDTLLKVAQDNTKTICPPLVQSLDDMIRSMMRKDGIPEEMPDMMPSSPLSIITNKNKMYGAVYMFNADVLGKFETDLYILPSSVHEVLVIPTFFTDNPNVLKGMVEQVNKEEVSPEDYLSDSVYKYTHSLGTITLA